MPLAWTMAARSLPKDGEFANGDAALLRHQGEYSLAAAIDGLGHGDAAALASQRACEFLAKWPLDGDLLAAMHSMHELLRGTRGAAATVCVMHGPELVCCGVGNVEVRSFGSKAPILLSPGVLGARVQHFRICRATLAVGTRLVLFSDGISHRTPFEALRDLDPDTLCDETIRHHRKSTDDATVVVCDLRSTP